MRDYDFDAITTAVPVVTRIDDQPVDDTVPSASFTAAGGKSVNVYRWKDDWGDPPIPEAQALCQRGHELLFDPELPDPESAEEVLQAAVATAKQAGYIYPMALAGLGTCYAALNRIIEAHQCDEELANHEHELSVSQDVRASIWANYGNSTWKLYCETGTPHLLESAARYYAKAATFARTIGIYAWGARVLLEMARTKGLPEDDAATWMQTAIALVAEDPTRQSDLDSILNKDSELKRLVAWMSKH